MAFLVFRHPLAWPSTASSFSTYPAKHELLVRILCPHTEPPTHMCCTERWSYVTCQFHLSPDFFFLILICSQNTYARCSNWADLVSNELFCPSRDTKLCQLTAIVSLRQCLSIRIIVCSIHKIQLEFNTTVTISCGVYIVYTIVYHYARATCRRKRSIWSGIESNSWIPCWAKRQ